MLKTQYINSYDKSPTPPFPLFCVRERRREEANNITHYYMCKQVAAPPPRRAGAGEGLPFCIFMQYRKRFLKPIKLQSESLGFRLRNQGF